jgi:hypothetical protein
LLSGACLEGISLGNKLPLDFVFAFVPSEDSECVVLSRLLLLFLDGALLASSLLGATHLFGVDSLDSAGDLSPLRSTISDSPPLFESPGHWEPATKVPIVTRSQGP